MNWNSVIASLVYSVIGLVVFVLGFVIIDRLTPYNLWDQIVKEKNMALAIVVGGVSIGISIIIAAAIH